MAQKRKTNHTKKKQTRSGQSPDSIETLLKKIEEKTARDVQDRLGDNWRDNLFEIVMTRLDLAAPHKKQLAALKDKFREDPKAVPTFARTYYGTMKRILILADAPSLPHHVAAFSVLYATIIDTFLKDDTRDHAKVMAALDKRLGYFEQFVNFAHCRKT
jgi:hypothetical protein